MGGTKRGCSDTRCAVVSWAESIEEEMSCLEENKTCTRVPLVQLGVHGASPFRTVAKCKLTTRGRLVYYKTRVKS